MQASQNLPSVGRLVTPLRDKFNYPVDKPRTRQTTDALRGAERNLDLFWKVIDQHFNASSQSDTIKHLFSGRLNLQRTPEWVELEKVAKSAEKQAEEEPSDSLSRLSIDHRQSAFEAPLNREKVKTRGLSHSPGSDGAEPPDLVPQRLIPDQQPRFAVSRRALKVFSTLFHTPNQTDMPGEVPWPDFLHAMGSAGFKIEKRYGSVWLFTPTKLDVENSIQFHEPHPSGRIPFQTARRHGRRLYGTYGWTSDVFALA